MKSQQNTLKACEARVKQIADEMIARFKEWYEHQNGPSPIKLGEARSPKSLRDWANSCIKRAVAMGPLDPRSAPANDHNKLLHSAAISRAAALAIEWDRTLGDRQREARVKAEATRKRREHEAALTPSKKRVAELQATIKEAASAERLLASIFKAYGAHEHAEAARKELEAMYWAAENAARELGKPAPTIERAQEADADAKGFADILLSAIVSRRR